MVATLARWADEDPATMRRLLGDAELRGQVLAALEATGCAADETVRDDARRRGGC